MDCSLRKLPRKSLPGAAAAATGLLLEARPHRSELVLEVRILLLELLHALAQEIDLGELLLR